MAICSKGLLVLADVGSMLPCELNEDIMRLSVDNFKLGIK
jgi:hypothetical protein